MRTVNLKLLNAWSQGKRTPVLELALKADVAEGTVRKLFKGHCPATKKVRVKISDAINASEDKLFPLCEKDEVTP